MRRMVRLIAPQLLSARLAGLVLAGLLLCGSLAVASTPRRAQAADVGLVVYGFVDPGDGILPSRVRAIVGDVVCGSAAVQETGTRLGFYALTVVSADQKAGCGVEGVAVRIVMISGEIDPGVVGAQMLWQVAGAQRYDLSTVVASRFGGSFVGVLPAGPGQALLRWVGASGVPIEQAIASIPRAVDGVYFWDVTTQQYRQYVPGADDSEQTYRLVDADDIVLVRVR